MCVDFLQNCLQVFLNETPSNSKIDLATRGWSSFSLLNKNERCLKEVYEDRLSNVHLMPLDNIEDMRHGILVAFKEIAPVQRSLDDCVAFRCSLT